MLTATKPMNIPTTDPAVPLVDTDVLRTTDQSVVSASPGRSVAEVGGIDLNAIGKVEARKIMSEEHRILGFRPPQGSLAAEAQAAAAKHPEGKPEAPRPDPLKLKALAKEDAERILAERKTSENGGVKQATEAVAKPVARRASPPAAGVNLNIIGEAEARTLMSHEHRALGFRPPPGSLAAEAQAAAAKHPEGAGLTIDEGLLKEVALKDAERIKADRELNIVGEVNVSTLGKDGADTIVNAAESELGHKVEAPEGSLLAEVQKAAEAHPEGGSLPAMDGDKDRLAEVGAREAQTMKEGEIAQGA